MNEAVPSPAGWYPDPSGQHGLRWWDGAAWTHHVSARLGVPAAAPVAVATAAPFASPTHVSPLADLLDPGPQDEAPARRPRRIWLWVTAAVMLLTLAGVATSALLGVIGLRGRLDTSAIEQQIAADLTRQVGSPTTVTCPDLVPLRPDSTFQCTATTDDGSTATVTVRQKDDAGNVEWNLSSA